MPLWIPGHDGPAERVRLPTRDQTSLDWIFQNISTGGGKRVTPSFLITQHMIVRLVLQLCRTEQRPHQGPEQGHRMALVRIQPQSHPDQVNVVGHQAVRWTKQAIARARVDHDLAESIMKRRHKPTSTSVRDAHLPMHHCVGLIKNRSQSRQIILARDQRRSRPYRHRRTIVGHSSTKLKRYPAAAAAHHPTPGGSDVSDPNHLSSPPVNMLTNRRNEQSLPSAPATL